jgi:hypothetical protein
VTDRVDSELGSRIGLERVRIQRHVRAWYGRDVATAFVEMDDRRRAGLPEES